MTVNVHWPGGSPASGAPVIVYPHGVGGGSILDVDGFQGKADANGRFTVSGCPCQLSIWFYEPHDSSTDPFNGGRDCWIIATYNNQLDLVTATPGDILDWKILDIPCSSTPYNPRDAQSVFPGLLQQQSEVSAGQVGQDFGYAGSWQQARARLG